MNIQTAEFADMKQLGHIMSISFRAAFSDFINRETIATCAREDGCIALLEGLYREGRMHFLIGGNSGMLCWQETENGAEIVAIHSLPESWGTGLGRAMLTEALRQIGDRPVFLWAFRENKRARRFYEKQGFCWDGSQRVSKFDGAVEVRYIKETNHGNSVGNDERYITNPAI